MPIPGLAALAPLLAPALATAVGSGLASAGRERPAQITNVPRMTQEQQQASSQALQQALSMIGQGAGGIDAQARQQFQQQTIPSIMERFSTLGTPGTTYGGMEQALAGAGANLESSLAAQKYGQIGNLFNIGMQPQFESMYQSAEPGMMQMAGQGIMGAAPYLGGLSQGMFQPGAQQQIGGALGSLGAFQQPNQQGFIGAQAPMQQLPQIETPQDSIYSAGGNVSPMRLMSALNRGIM